MLNAERMDRGDRLTLSAGTPIIPVYICIDQRVSQRRHRNLRGIYDSVWRKFMPAAEIEAIGRHTIGSDHHHQPAVPWPDGQNDIYNFYVRHSLPKDSG